MSTKILCSRTRRSARIDAARSVTTKPYDVDEIAADSSTQNHSERDIEIMPEQPIESEIRQVEEGIILSLNDDCLLEIFSYLKMTELCAVKDCCRRFSELAISVVQNGFRNKKYDEYLSLPSKPRPSDEDFAEKALMDAKFGKFITCVEIFGRHKDAWKIGPILKNCTSLKSLRLRNVSLGMVPVTKLKKMFKNIETLELLRCRVSLRKLAGILNAIKSLKHLLIYGRMSVSSDLLSAIAEHENIESVRLRITGLHDANAAHHIAYAKQLQPLRNLKSLELLYIPAGHSFVAAMHELAAIDSLEELTLSWFIPDEEIFNTLDMFANLKLFTIHTYKDIKDVVLTAATQFVATKRLNHVRMLDEFGKMPDYTHTLVRNN